MNTDYIDLSTLVAEEGPQPASDQRERLLAGRSVRAPVVVRDDEEEMLSVGSNVCLPEVLEVVIVSRGAASFDLGENATSRLKGKHKVWPRPGEKALLWRENNFLLEPELVF